MRDKLTKGQVEVLEAIRYHGRITCQPALKKAIRETTGMTEDALQVRLKSLKKRGYIRQGRYKNNANYTLLV